MLEKYTFECLDGIRIGSIGKVIGEHAWGSLVDAKKRRMIEKQQEKTL